MKVGSVGTEQNIHSYRNFEKADNEGSKSGTPWSPNLLTLGAGPVTSSPFCRIVRLGALIHIMMPYYLVALVSSKFSRSIKDTSYDVTSPISD